MIFHRVLVPVVALTLLGSGCVTSVSDIAHGLFERLASKAVETGAEDGIKRITGTDIGVKITETGASFVDPKTGRQFAIGDAVTIPAGFPADVPLYSAIVTSVSVDGGGANAGYIFSTTSTRAAVRDWFSAAAKKSDWTNEQVFETVDQTILSFTKPATSGTAKMTVTISPPNVHGETSVVVTRRGTK